MIQRIQHLYLFLALLLNAGFFFTPLFIRLLEDPTSWISSGVFSGLAISGVLAVTSIFMYAKRPQQILYVKRAILFQILGIGVSFAVFFMPDLMVSGLDYLPLGLPLLALILMILAVRYIRKDEALIKSMDRLR
jgi:hypothetical protein